MQTTWTRHDLDALLKAYGWKRRALASLLCVSEITVARWMASPEPVVMDYGSFRMMHALQLVPLERRSALGAEINQAGEVYGWLYATYLLLREVYKDGPVT